ncbi:MAG: porphobilinogen synthase [Candidatus Pacearchaeota archaeon]|jgi:porphobilinogen synthase
MNKIEYIACVFIKEEAKNKEKSPLDNVDYHTITSGLKYIEGLLNKGINKFLIFGSTANKSIEFACTNGMIRRFIHEAKSKFGGKIVLFADVGLSPYSKDGHSTIIKNGKINYEKSYELASKLAITFAEAGADYIAPCLSLPEQVKMLRKALNKSGFNKTKIMAYSAKFSSTLYGPYRQIIQSPLQGKDKKAYQTDYSDYNSALNQIKHDEQQRADIVMVKPAMIYLDIVYQARQMTSLPLAVYHVSGEYSMIKSAAQRGMIDEDEVFDEVHTGFKRCGVNFVIGYAPEHFIRWINKK